MYSNKKFLYVVAITFLVALLLVAYIGGRVRQAEVEISDLYNRMQSLERSGATILETFGMSGAPDEERDAERLIDEALDRLVEEELLP